MKKKNRFIKNRKQFLIEHADQMNPDALDILSKHDQGQDPDLRKTLDKLNEEPASGKVRVRFSPSPTGKLHIGGIKTALYNYLFAKKNKGTFYIRIEDTDRKRFDAGAEEYIKKSLEWCGIEPDESPWNPGAYGPYRQSERDYSKHVKYLLDNGFAYYAFDTEEDIEIARKKTPNFTYDARTRSRMKNSLSLPKEEVDELMKSGYVIRFKVEPGVDITCDDIIMGPVTINTKRMDDKVLVKSNGIPTYTLASICDDHDMKTTHVIRGSEWLPSAPFHIMLYEAFGWTPPKFAHVPLILNPPPMKGKLSKRNSLKMGFPVFPFGGEGEDETGAKVNYKGFKDEGYEPEAVLHFLATLGWSPNDEKQVLTMTEMISAFDLKDVLKTNAAFDINKAKSINSAHLKGKPTIELLKHIEKGSSYSYPEDKLKKIVELAKERSVFAKDMQVIADIFFKPVVLTDEQMSTIIPEYKTLFSEFVKEGGPSDWKAASLRQYITDLCARLNIKMGKVMPYLRLALAGGVSGPDLMITSEILGKEETLKRIQNSL